MVIMVKDIIEDGSESDIKYFGKIEAMTPGPRGTKLAVALQATCKRARKQGILDIVTEITKRILVRLGIPNHQWMPYLRFGQEIAGAAIQGQWYRISEIKSTYVNRKGMEIGVIDEIAEIFGDEVET